MKTDLTTLKKKVAHATAKPRAHAAAKSTPVKYIKKVDLNALPEGMNPKLAQTVRNVGLTTDPSLQPKNGATHCNQAADKYARQFGYKGLEDKHGVPMMATDMFRKMNAPGSGWKKVSAQEAIDAAKNGKLVFAAVPGSPHGHIAAVTGQWSPGVPGISQAGSKPNFEFGVWRRPEPANYFVKE
jgi:hypothetical protein